MNEEIIDITQQSQLPANDFSKFETALVDFGLPSDNIIAPLNERQRIMSALPEFLLTLSPEVRKDARYLSKFIAGTAVGLFDASLNYVWNEVVINLRKKVIIYGVDYFYNSAIGGSQREQYSTEEDLQLVKDIVLLDTCKKLELIPDLLHRKLSHILDMRNQIGASHPTGYAINAYELLGWLQDCIDGVLSNNISDSAITVKAIIDNTKKMTAIIDSECLAHFEKSIKQLSTNMVSNLLTSLFGMFVSPNMTSKITQENILKLANVAWEYTTDEIKYELGKNIDVYRANLDDEKVEKAELFFTKCNGEKYFTKDAKIIKITCLCEDLENARTGWDNYINETYFAKKIMSLIKEINDVPEIRIQTLIKVFLKCRIGKNCSYCNGVSPNAIQYYNHFFTLLDESTTKIVIEILASKEMESFLYGSYRKINIIEICNLMLSDILPDRISEILKYIIGFTGSFENVFRDERFKQISKGIL